MDLKEFNNRLEETMGPSQIAASNPDKSKNKIATIAAFLEKKIDGDIKKYGMKGNKYHKTNGYSFTEVGEENIPTLEEVKSLMTKGPTVSRWITLESLQDKFIGAGWKEAYIRISPDWNNKSLNTYVELTS